MRKIIQSGLIVFCTFCWCLNCTEKRDPVALTKKRVAENIDILSQYISDSLIQIVKSDAARPLLQQRFIRTRSLYKNIEWATEYFMPTTTRFVNGPPVPEIEAEENKVLAPEGLQVIEAMLYAEEEINFAELLRQCRLLVSYSKTYKAYWSALEISNAQIFDALKAQVFRIAALGISGFDAPLAKTGMQEAAVSLKSVREIVSFFNTGNAVKDLCTKAASYAAASTDFNSFDRLHFIKDYCNPLTMALVAAQSQLSIPFVKDRRLLPSYAGSLFDVDAFDVNAYAPDSSYFTNKYKVALGRKLFYDPALSLNNKRSCASCHNPAKAFADTIAKSIALQKGFVKRNTPSLLNAALQPWQFYDMRTTSLENQSRDVIQNKEEMHGDLSKFIRDIEKDTTYLKLYQQAFTGKKILEQDIQNAIACYVRSLTFMNSRFDKYMQNKDTAVLSDQEKKGFNLFMGKAKCGTCHFAPLFNGTVPPMFVKMESEVIGVPKTKEAKQLDGDIGRFAVTKVEPYKNAFKTTTVRNIALTAPYMHNGIFQTLEEVIEFYDKGGGIGLGLTISNQTLAPEPLNLTNDEKKCLVAFLKALTDDIKQ